MRILLLANSYPTVHSPSGASYITARVRETRALALDEVTAHALVPRHVGPLAIIRRAAGAHSGGMLRLHRSATEFTEVPVPWTLTDTVMARLSRRPDGLVERAVAGILARSHVIPDVVHAHGMYVLPAGEVAHRLANRWGVPFVVSMHGSDVSEVMPRVAEQTSSTLRAAAATVYVSEALRRRAVAMGAPEQSSHVIPNGVDPHLFHPGEQERAVEGPRLLYVGNLLPVKGVDRLPGILAAVRRRHPGATLDVLGSGRDEEGLTGHAGVRLHGRVPPSEVADRMRSASVLLVPSRDEGWGCVASEAYACGTPVVASAVGGLCESVAADGLVDPEAADLSEAFADAVDRVLAGPLRAPRIRTWGDVVRQERAVLEEAVRSAGRGCG